MANASFWTKVYSKVLFLNVGKYALAFCGTHWNVQLASQRGRCKGFISYGGHNNKCPHHPAYQWKYYHRRMSRWISAGKGVSVWCKS